MLAHGAIVVSGRGILGGTADVGPSMSDRPVLQPTESHPITVEPTGKHVTVRVNGEIVADTDDALTLQESTYPAVQYVPLADVVLMATFAGPNAASSSMGDPARQLCTRPMYESFGSRGVLPIGVRQQAVYQRRSPLSLSDMQRSCCLPRTIRRKRGLVATISVPERSLRIRSGLPRNRANA